ncbi:MAG TPA: UvrD-helicase domain-containing protein [Polyangia bacterium]|nr:UvrD-helicase domain-containing protein [Polyangia bacterium]
MAADGPTVTAYVFPEALRALPRDASAVVEASAGTGKTFLLEHVVADRLIRGEARLEEILVVTFTEKAIFELVWRLRALIQRLLAHDAPAPPGTDPECAWVLDGVVRARLLDAQRSFDSATITTIHGFCQRVLTEDAFAGRRLLAQERVDGKRAFSEAFKETLRTTLATDERLEHYLEAWLDSGKTTEALARTLGQAYEQQRPWGMPYDEERLRAATRDLAALPFGECFADVERVVGDRTKSKTIISRVEAVREIVAAHREGEDLPHLLRAIDELFDRKRYTKLDVFSYVEKNLPAPPARGPAARLKQSYLAFADAAVPLELAVAQLFLPFVRDTLTARKSAAGRYDFDDMLRLVAQALRGPGGAGLVETLRRRYRLAVIDEFQDTDDVQWEIFRTIFHDSDGRNPLVVIGDPKQSIYGFRGADVATYREARRVIAGGPTATLALDRNFRSTPALVAATNAIFDDAADDPFFGERGLFQDALPGRSPAPEARAAAPLKLLAVRPAEGSDASQLRLRHLRRALTHAIADEIETLRSGPTPVPLREVFVLTRTNAEAQQIARTLRDRGLPHVLYNQEGLYRTEEARQLRDLLAAIDDPRDPARRLLAALTPFFGLTLADLPALAADPKCHPLEERLATWRAVADARDWSLLFERIVSESGFVERELLTGGSARRLTNTLHLCDLLRARAAREPISLGELVRYLTALTEGIIVPDAEEGNVQRLEGERDAVQIMSIHKSKGLEADHVFLYGAFTPWRGSTVRLFERDGQRWLFAGKPRRSDLDRALERETEGEDQRLLYVALTRARRRLYLPYAGDPTVEESAQYEDFWRVNGAYRHVHRRLRALSRDGGAVAHFESKPIDCPTPPDDTPARIAAAVRTWRPAPAELALDFPAAALAETRREHAGIVLTSYTRIKQAHGGYQPPTEVLDEQPAPVPVAPPDPGRLPGGTLSGIFLHAALEEVPLASLTGAPAATDWAALPEIRALFDAAFRRTDRDPAHRADAERIVHAALTTPLALPGGAALAGVARAARVAREVEFLFPFPAAAGGAAAGFVKGYIDFVFEHEGRAFFGDWKSDLLPDFSPAAVAAHVAANYELQRRLYALALAKMLGVVDEADYEARFGGMVYVFLRALPDGLEIGRPSWAELEAWERELAAELARDREGA